MKRTNSIRVRHIFKACLTGLLSGVMGWCIFLPNVAHALLYGIGAHASAVLAGPAAARSAPSLGQLSAFAWEETSFLACMVFFAFFVAGGVPAYLTLEWGGKSRSMGVRK